MQQLSHTIVVVKNKVNEVKTERNTSKNEDGNSVFTGGETIYTYTVDFDKEEDNSNNIVNLDKEEKNNSPSKRTKRKCGEEG